MNFLVSLVSFGQTEINLKDYFPLDERLEYHYQCTYTKPNGALISEIDTINIKSDSLNSKKYYYFSKNEPIGVMAAHSFLDGVMRYSSDSLVYIPVLFEDQISTSKEKEVNVLPTKIFLDTIYRSSMMLAQDGVMFKFSSPDSILHKDGLVLMEKASFFGNNVEVDSVWLKKGEGCVVYKKSTGRTEVLLNLKARRLYHKKVENELDFDCYKILASHNKKTEIYPFFLYNTISVKVDGDYKRIVITKFHDDTLFVRYRTRVNNKAVWSEIQELPLEKITFLIHEGLGYTKVRPSNYNFSIHKLEHSMYCKPEYWVEGSTCPYP